MRALGAVLLGAGMSERFGTENKLLADIGGDPLIRKVVSEVIGSGIAEVVVVTGCDKVRIATAIEDLPARCAHNKNWRSGMGSVGCRWHRGAPRRHRGSILVVPGDMPRLTSLLLVGLASAFDEKWSQKGRLSSDGRRRPAKPRTLAAALFPEAYGAVRPGGGERVATVNWPRVRCCSGRRPGDPRGRRHT